MRGNGGAAGPLPFIFSVTVGSGQSFQLPTISGGTYDCIVDWGDTTSSTLTVWDVGRSHTYAVGGTYDIKISGVFNGWSVNNYADRLKITEVKQWGTVRLFDSAFNGCSNVTITATDLLNTVGITSMSGWFLGCASITTIPGIEYWDTSAVTRFTSMFRNCTNFNSDLTYWDTSAAVSMRYMFGSSASITFNGNVDNWDMSNVVDAEFMFQRCPNFNRDISNWNTASLQIAGGMFFGCSSFAADVSGWNTSSLTTASSPAGNGMFEGCTSFNSNLGGWDVSQLTNARDIIASSGVSTSNYDALLIGWAAQSVQSSVELGANPTKYTSGGAAEAARNTLISIYGWTINDGGPV